MGNQALKNAIREAFADVPYPGDAHIGDPDGRDDGETITELLCGRDWHSLKSHAIWCQGLYWMTPQTVHYYMPAYLLASLEGDSGDTIDWVLSGLKPHLDNGGIGDKFQEAYRRFTQTQRQAVANFLSGELEGLVAFHKKQAEYHGASELDTASEKALRELRDHWTRFSAL